LLVRAPEEHLHHVQHHHDDHHAGAPVMEAAHQASGGELGEDVAKAVVCVTWRGRVVERQEGSGEGLGQEQEHRHAAEDLVPAARGGDVFVEKLADGGLDSSAMVQPLADAVPTLSHPTDSLGFSSLPSWSFLPWTLV